MIAYHDIVFLRRTADKPIPTIPVNTRLIERDADFAETLAAMEREQLRTRSLAMIQTRFKRGLRLFAIEQGGKTVGWSWMAIGSWRYIDELRWHIPLQEYQAWGRDAYVIPEARGQRLALVLMGGLAEVLEHPIEYFSDVDARNWISLRAHASGGFDRVGRARALELGRRRILRSAPPPGIPQPRGLRVEDRWLRMTDEEVARHRDEMA